MNRQQCFCISCGVGEQEKPPQLENSEFWVRQDDAFGLGLCHQCVEFCETWDQGVRDVRHFRDELKSHSQGSLLEVLVQEAKLPSFPHVLLEIYRELDSEVAGIERIVPLLESDPSLTARTLKLGNSAFYARAQQYTQVKEVVTRVGPVDLWSLLVATEVKSLFYGIDTEQMDMERFWKHSLFTACASRKISEGLGVGLPGDLFIAGLLHDLGKLVLLQAMPIEYRAVLHRLEEGGESARVEQELLGITHPEVGSALFEAWNFPTLLVDLTRNHHLKPVEMEDPQAVLYLADHLANAHFQDDLDGVKDIPVDEALYTTCCTFYDRMSELVL